MATEDRNNKKPSGKKTDKGVSDDDLRDKDKVNDKAADDETTPGSEETEPTPEADTSQANEIKAATPEEVEEGGIDEEETESLSTDCMCVEQDGDYYCFKLKQGRWIQWSVVPYPTKKMCEAACCNK